MFEQSTNQISRRTMIAASGAGMTLAASPSFARRPLKPKRIAAIATVYRYGSHADVILGKILEGWKQDGGPGPALEIAGMYVEQQGDDDMSKPLCKKYGVPMFDTIEGAVTAGTDGIPVDGVVSIAEHGNYPFNEIGQHLYPRRRFFEGITNTFEKYDKVVPVFNDKHLGPEWADAKWMYEKAKELKIPFMSGSSLPVSYRKPELEVPLGTRIESAVAVGYDKLDIYASHALDCYQTIVERRKGAEQGVKSVQYFDGEEMWDQINAGCIDKEVLEACVANLSKVTDKDMREDPAASLFLFEYVDGFQGSLVMLPRTVNRMGTAVRLSGVEKPLATEFEERIESRHPHFAYLTKGIERMMHTGKPMYPVERCYLIAGILDRAINSRAQDGKKFMTPELEIDYKPVAYPHAPYPPLDMDPRR